MGFELVCSWMSSTCIVFFIFKNILKDKYFIRAPMAVLTVAQDLPPSPAEHLLYPPLQHHSTTGAHEHALCLSYIFRLPLGNAHFCPKKTLIPPELFLDNEFGRYVSHHPFPRTLIPDAVLHAGLL